MEKIIKVVTIFTFTIIIISNIGIYAFGVADIDGKGVPTDVNDSVKDLGNDIIGIIQVIGVVASVIVLIIIGIKYMTGSVEEKAEYKKALMPYLIGALIVFTCSIIPNIIYKFSSSL